MPKKKSVTEPPIEVTVAEASEEEPKDLADVVESAIAKIQAELGKARVKASVADLVRLLQLRKELSDTQPKTVTVRWIEEWNETSNDN